MEKGEVGHTQADEVAEIFTLKTLNERVRRLEAENKELKVNNSILHTQYTSQCETQSDILRTLHADIEWNTSKNEELENKIQKLEELLQDQKQEAKDDLEEKRALWESRIAELQTKNEDLERKLYEVAEFQQNKAEMELELARLKQKLELQAEDHTRDVSAFDRKKAVEIDQLKKDMHKSIMATTEMLKNRTKDQLDTTTKRTIMENEQMATELHFQSKETERLLDRNQVLTEENSQLRRNLAIHKDLEKELARRTHVYQKVIKKMKQTQGTTANISDRSLDLGEETTQEPMSPQVQSRDLPMDMMMGKVQSRDLPMGMMGPQKCEECAPVKRQVEGITSTLQMVRHEFAQYRRDHATLTQLQDQSTRLIIATLYELKNQRECDPFPPATYDEHANWQFTNMTQKQKEYFFRVLLEKLNSSMCGSCFPTGPQPNQNASASSLPQLVKDGSQASGAGQSAAHFSQFLWSVATHGANEPHSHGGPRKDLISKGCQTETEPTDPCFKEGLWHPHSRLKHSEEPTVKPHMVSGSVRPWGSRPNAGKPQRSMLGVNGSGSGRAV